MVWDTQEQYDAGHGPRPGGARQGPRPPPARSELGGSLRGLRISDRGTLRNEATPGGAARPPVPAGCVARARLPLPSSTLIFVAMAEPAGPPGVRLAELLGVLSLATDLRWVSQGGGGRRLAACGTVGGATRQEPAMSERSEPAAGTAGPPAQGSRVDPATGVFVAHRTCCSPSPTRCSARPPTPGRPAGDLAAVGGRRSGPGAGSARLPGQDHYPQAPSRRRTLGRRARVLRRPLAARAAADRPRRG